MSDRACYYTVCTNKFFVAQAEGDSIAGVQTEMKNQYVFFCIGVMYRVSKTPISCLLDLND